MELATVPEQLSLATLPQGPGMGATGSLPHREAPPQAPEAAALRDGWKAREPAGALAAAAFFCSTWVPGLCPTLAAVLKTLLLASV